MNNQMALFYKFSFSTIVGLSIYIFIIIFSFIFAWKNMLIIGIGIFITIFILMMIYLTLRSDKKSMILTSMLNLTPLYPTGYLYANEKVFPEFNLKEIGCFALHYIIFPLDWLVTFILSSLKLYPIKEGEEFVLF